MRERFTAIIEAGRDRVSPGYATLPGVRYGRFRVRCPLTSELLTIIAADGQDWYAMGLPGIPWEHVSVSASTRCPIWEEMAWVKEQFWADDEMAIQMHVPKVLHINVHPYALHLWKPVGIEIPLPPRECV